MPDRPGRMLLSREIMPRYARMSPESENIFDNLHMLHGIAYSILAFLSVWLSRRILWFGPALQALHVFVILAVAQAGSLLVRLAAGNAFPGWPIVVGPMIGAMLWPFVTWLLLLPQRRPQREQAI